MGLKTLFGWRKPTSVASVTIPATVQAAPEGVKTEHQQREAVLGCILGQAIGDAIGHPCEFNGSFGKTVPAMYKGAQFTDDTQMMDAIARALLMFPPHKFGMDKFMTRLGEEFAYWQKHPLGGSHRSPGGACSSACSALNSGKEWQHSGGLTAKGNGTAMRAGVVGAFYHRNLTTAWEVGCMTSIPTHNNLESILMAGSVALLCACGVRGIPFASAIAMVMRNIERFEKTVPEWPKNVKIGSAYEEQNPWYAAAHLAAAFAMGKQPGTEYDFYKQNGTDFATVPAVAAAVYYNTRYSNFSDIVRNCVANTADADTTGAIAGTIAGARFGAQFIPGQWRADVELSDYFHKLADDVWKASQDVSSDDTAK